MDLVAAFFGAAFSGLFAVAAVLVTDWLRDRQTLRTIRGEVAIAKDHAVRKLESVQNMLRAMRESQQILPGEILRFDVGVIRENKARVLHLLDPRQRQALDAVLFRMERVDAHLDEIHEDQRSLRAAVESGASQNERLAIAARISRKLSDTGVNVRVLIEIADRYVAGDFVGITTKQYREAAYLEPAAPPAPLPAGPPQANG